MSLAFRLPGWTKEARKSVGYLVRNGPVGAAQRILWDRTVAPTIFSRAFDFVATTNFGACIEGNTGDFIQRRICFFGVWEPAITDWIAAGLRPGDTFIDVGANIGYYSLLAAKLVGETGRVIAIEASPVTFGLLERNLARNAATNVRALNIAAAESSGTLDLFAGPGTNIGMTTTIARPAATAQWTIPAATLVQACGADLESARIIKIDVEGGEGAVVAGLAPALAKLRPDCEIIVELSPTLLGPGYRALDIVDSFRAAGYRPSMLDNEYHAVSYLSRRHRGLRPFSWPIRGQADVVFSRA